MQWQLPGSSHTFIVSAPLATGSTHSYEVALEATGWVYFYMDGVQVQQVYDENGSGQLLFAPTQAQMYGETHSAADQMFGDTGSPEVFSNSYYENSYYPPQVAIGTDGALHSWYTLDAGTPSNTAYFGNSLVSSTQVDIWDYACPPHMMAYTSQGSTQYLRLQNTSGSGYTEPDTMQPGTSPSIAQLSDGSYVVAFQGQDGDLCMYTTANGYTNCTNLGMDSSTSNPSVAALPNSQFIIAFRVNTDALWLWSGNEGGGGNWVNTGEPLMANTNPAITATSNGGWVAAFQMNNGYLYTYYNNSAYGSGLGMQNGTSPAMTTTASGGWELAFEANSSSNNNLFWYQPSGQWTDTNQGMASNSSPSISQLSDGTDGVAFENSSDYLNVWNSGNPYNSVATGQPMWGGTDPGIAGTPLGGEWVDFMASSSHLMVWSLQNGVRDTGSGIWGGTSPSIAN